MGGHCTFCKADAGAVAVTADAAARGGGARAPPPPLSTCDAPPGPLAALEDIHDIVRGYVDACAEFELRPAAAAYAPPRAPSARRGRRRRECAGGVDGSDFGAPDSPASDGALSIDSDGGAWGSPTGRSPSPSVDSEVAGPCAALALAGLPPATTTTAAVAHLSLDGAKPALRVRTRRSRGGRRASVDGGTASDSDAVSLSPVF